MKRCAHTYFEWYACIWRIAITAICACLLSGCFGLGFVTFGKTEWDKEKFYLASERNEFVFSSKDYPYSEADVRAKWGKPDAVEYFAGCKVLNYDTGLAWSGFGPFVITLPIPLAIPTGRDYKRIYLKNDKTVGVIGDSVGVHSAYGFFCSSRSCEFVAGAVPEDNSAQTSRESWCGGAN